MSLRDFIRATANDFEEANKGKAAKTTSTEPEGRTEENVRPECSKTGIAREGEETPQEKEKQRRVARGVKRRTVHKNGVTKSEHGKPCTRKRDRVTNPPTKSRKPGKERKISR